LPVAYTVKYRTSAEIMFHTRQVMALVSLHLCRMSTLLLLSYAYLLLKPENRSSSYGVGLSLSTDLVHYYSSQFNGLALMSLC